MYWDNDLKKKESYLSPTKHTQLCIKEWTHKSNVSPNNEYWTASQKPEF